ncbi:MAG TPA: hypothetical protein VLR49_05385 [Ferruginibacter sp.]|nr:hypothetical protein [Ferruginibacter sp.]
MQYCKYVITILFVLPLSLFAQDITGLWKGTLYNDTTQQFYKYEIGISKEKGKYTGFSHTWFLLGDKQYYGVKKVKIRIADDGKIIVEDDGLISNNYPVPPSKNVRQLNVLTLEASDSVMKLTGPFTTNRTKEYRPLTGTINLQRKNDFWQSALVPHLQELGKEKDLSFVVEESANLAKIATQQKNVAEQEQQEKTLAQKEKAQAEMAKQQLLQQEETNRKKEAELLVRQEAEAKKEKLRVQAEIAKQEAEREKEMMRISKMEADAKANAEKERIQSEIAKQEAIKKQEAEKEKAIKALAKKEAEAKTLAEKEKAREEFAKQQAARALEIEKENALKLLAQKQAAAKANAEKQQIALAKQQQAEKEQADKIVARQEADAFAKKEKEKAELAKHELKRQQEIETAAKLLAKQQAEVKEKVQPKLTNVNNTAVAASGVNERTTVLQQSVTFSSDSLQLSLYDNGEVDGDTVSVLMNGQLILAKQGLSTIAIKKTIYIPSSMDQVELVMYAESLGSIPPNTGLLVVRDGKNLYEVRFSGDLQKNASIVFNRKKE